MFTSYNLLRLPATARRFGRDVAGLIGPICTAGRSLCRLLKIWGQNVLLLVVLVAVSIGLTRFASHVSRSGRELDSNNVPDGGFVVRREVLYVWLPEALTWLANARSRSPLIRDHQELMQLLELQNLEDLCYALTIRAHQANGKVSELTFFRHPYYESHRFPELLDVLATAAGSPPSCSDEFKNDFSTASVEVVPEETCKRGFREFVVEELTRLSPPGGRPRYVTALGQTDEPVGWRANKAKGGVLIDVASGEVITRGLSMPHSPRWHAGRLWVCESGAGTFGFIDPNTRTYTPIAEVPGFTRGVDHFAGNLAFIGGCRRCARAPSSAASQSPSGSLRNKRTCGVSRN